jgi:hypothetical protein
MILSALYPPLTLKFHLNVILSLPSCLRTAQFILYGELLVPFSFILQQHGQEPLLELRFDGLAM